MTSHALIDRLRANLRAAEIPVTDDDLGRLVADGYLDRADETRRMLAGLENGSEPDYLAAWGPDSPGDDAHSPASAASDRRIHSAPRPAAATLSELSRALRAGTVSPVELTERSLARLHERDPVLNAFQLVLADDALEAAKRAETEIAAGRYLGPLHGVPVAAKDLLAMRGTVTTAGSRILAGNVTDHDAAAVEQLRAAGAVIVGKTRLSEFAYWPGSTNPHYGPTRNPHDLARDTGGSSSGSAAAVADGIVAVAMGSDTGGSIRIPAALCGVVGLKPTFGRVSLFGCAPLAWSLDHLGPLTRSVEDAATVLAVLAGPDARDPRTRPGSHFAVPPDLDGGIEGLRVGVMTSDGTPGSLGTPEAVAAWEASGHALADAGATLVPVDLSEMHALWRACGLILAVEAAALHTSMLRTDYGSYGEFCRGRLLGAFAYGSEDFLRAQKLRADVRRVWNRHWNRLDVISTPCQPDVAPALGRPASTRYTNPFNAMGWPAVSVPFGVGAEGLPLATQLVGRPWDEGTVLRAARTLEIAAAG